MYGAFTDPEPFGGLPHGGAVFDDVGGQLTGPFLNVPFQSPTLPIPIYRIYMREWGKNTFFRRRRCLFRQRRPRRHAGAFQPLCMLLFYQIRTLASGATYIPSPG